MNGFTPYQLFLERKATNTNIFLTRQQLIEKNKKEKEQLKSSRILNKTISKPQSVLKISTSKASTTKLNHQKKTFSCSKFQISEVIPEYQLLSKQVENTQTSQQACLNTEYFNFVNKKKNITENQDNKEELNYYQKMKNELIKSFLDIETMLNKKNN